MKRFFKPQPTTDPTQLLDNAAPPQATQEKVEDGLAGQQTPVARDPALERRVVRRLDLNLVPLVMVLYLLAFLDRSNIGNAVIAGMEDDLELTGDRYEWLLTIFYIAYIVFEPGTLGWKLVKPHYWAASVVFLWGVMSTSLAAVQTWSGAMVLRFFMGASEACYGPGIPYLLSFFYLRHEVGFRAGIFLSAAPLASTFSGALAYGITSGNPVIAKWRVLFLVEGLPTICMAVVAFFFMPDSPDTARFLTEEEKVVAKARAVRQTGTEKRVGSIDFKDIALTFMDPKAYFTALMYFSCNVSFASLPVFLPIILEEMGFGPVTSQGLSAPPYFISFLITCGSTWVADRTQQRGLMIVTLSAIGGIGYVILASTTSVAARYVAVFLVAGGVFPSIGNILPWVLNNQGSDTRRGSGIVILNLIGQCGPLLGTRVYPDGDKPRFIKGHSICAAFMFFTTLLAGGLRLLLMWENKKLDRKYGTRADLQARAAEEKEQSVGEENYGPAYRYVL